MRAMAEGRVDQTGRALELPEAPSGLDEIRRVVTVFRELREGVTADGRTKVKSPSGTLSTAEVISVVTHGLALAAHFGDGVLRPADVAAGIVGAVVQDPVSDRVVWQEYLEAVGVPAARAAAWTEGFLSSSGLLLVQPEMLEAVEPDVHLVGTLLSLNRVMPDKARESARAVVRKVVDERARPRSTATTRPRSPASACPPSPAPRRLPRPDGGGHRAPRPARLGRAQHPPAGEAGGPRRDRWRAWVRCWRGTARRLTAPDPRERNAMPEAVIVAAARSPIGRAYKGSLKEIGRASCRERV